MIVPISKAFFCTNEMKRAMEGYGDIIFLDGTYKLLNLELTLMLFLVEDGSTHSEIVGVALLQQEDKISFEWLNKTFRSVHGKNSNNIRCIMADKDLLERDVLKEVFPGIPIYICRYHALKSLALGFAKYTSSKAVKHDCLVVIEKMIYSKSQKAYDDLYKVLRKIATDEALEYFDCNWHSIYDEWTAFSMNCETLGNFTNNRLESINKHIKTVVKKRSSLVDFLDNFFIWIQSHNQENDTKTARALLKRPVLMDSIREDEESYLSILMPEPFAKVKAELKKTDSILLIKRSSDNNKRECVAKDNNVVLKVSPNSCECHFRACYGLALFLK